MPGINDPWFLDWYKKSNIIILVGQGSWEDEALEDTRHIHNILSEKNIPARVEYWGYDVNHDWPWWYKMMNHVLYSF